MMAARSRLQGKGLYTGRGIYSGRGLYYGRGKYEGLKKFGKSAGKSAVNFMKKNKTAQMLYDIGLGYVNRQTGMNIPQQQYGPAAPVPYAPKTSQPTGLDYG